MRAPLREGERSFQKNSLTRLTLRDETLHANLLGPCLPSPVYHLDRSLSSSDSTVFEPLNIPEPILSELRANIARRLTPQPVKIRADIHVTCFSYAGIDAIRRALKAGEACSTETVPIKIKLVAPPLYVLLSNSTDKNAAIETLERAISVIEKTIKKEKGEVKVEMRPKAVSETDDMELNALMERVARENKEVSGDEDSDDE